MFIFDMLLKNRVTLLPVTLIPFLYAREISENKDEVVKKVVILSLPVFPAFLYPI